jgi:hypothetical protein
MLQNEASTKLSKDWKFFKLLTINMRAYGVKYKIN